MATVASGDTPGSGSAGSFYTWLTSVLAGLGALAVAVPTFLSAMNIVDWSTPQTAVVSAAAVAWLGLAGAIVAHFWHETKEEPVAIAGTLTAAATATAALGGAFGW